MRVAYCSLAIFVMQVIAILLPNFKGSKGAKSNSINLAFWSVAGILLLANHVVTNWVTQFDNRTPEIE